MIGFANSFGKNEFRNEIPPCASVSCSVGSSGDALLRVVYSTPIVCGGLGKSLGRQASHNREKNG